MKARQKYGLLIAIAILVIMFFVPAPEGLTPAGIRTLGCTLSLLVIFATGALPLGLASWVYMMLYYLLGATESIVTAISGMATPPVFFIIASFGMSEAVSGSPISRRILNFMLRLFGKSLKSMILGIMFATAIVSAFISNVPVTAMFVTIGLTFLKLYEREEDKKKTGKSLMIAIPVAAMIGGIMTPVGSSPNLVAINILREMTGHEISFIEWACYGVPIAMILIPLAWKVITTVFPPVELEKEKFKKFVADAKVTEKIEKREAKIMAIMGTMIVLWVLSSWVKGINLYVVAVLGVALMMMPGIDVLDWTEYKRIVNWDVVLVTASVISLGNVISANGLSTWIVEAIFPTGLALPAFVMVLITAVFVIVMLLVVPISGALIQILAGPLIAVAASCGIQPVILIITLCFCATNCYLLPIDTVPLLAYSTGYFQMLDMPKSTVIILACLALLCAIWCPLVCGFLM